MAEDSESGKGRGGLFRLVGRLFGRGRGPEPGTAETPTEPGPASTGAPAEVPAAPADEAGPAAAPAPVDDAEEDDDEDALVLGPALRATSSERGQDAAEHAASAAGDEDALTLTGDTAADTERDRDAPAPEAGTGADHPRAEVSEEESIFARLRAERESETPGAADAGESDETATEEEWPATAGYREAPHEPEEEGHRTSLFWFPGEERCYEEGAFPAGDAGPEGPEPKEAEEMGRNDETETGEDAPTPELESATVTLFPGAAGAAQDEKAGAAGEEAGAEDVSPPAGTGEAAGTEAVEAEEGAGAELAGEEENAEIQTAGAEESAGTEAADEEESAGTEAADEEESPTAEAVVEAPHEPESTGSSEDAGERPEEAGGLQAAAMAGAVTHGHDAETGPGEEPAESGPDDRADDLEETVRRLIREELEGELGERLSKNVRRIVREEVAHAMLRNR